MAFGEAGRKAIVRGCPRRKEDVIGGVAFENEDGWGWERKGKVEVVVDVVYGAEWC